MGMKIHSATVVVADQDAALDFYVNTLGWTKGLDSPMGPGMRYLTVVPPGAETQLALGQPGWFDDAARPGVGKGISISTNDIEGVYKTLTERGVRFKQPLEMMPWGQRATWFYDIDGNEFFLAEEP